jgi:predicted esterase
VSVHTIATRTHGRYLVDAPEGEGPWPMLVGFHGYAEGAERMLEELGRVRGDRRWLLVSIQGLSRFYSRAGTVVASWMTREDRELAIADNLAYIGAVVAAVRQAHPVTDTIVYAGFSQGAAMAYRATAFVSGDRIPAAGGAILLAGDIPPDVVPRLTELPALLIGRGRADELYTKEMAAIDRDRFRAAGVEPIWHDFDGGHAWGDSFVARAHEFLTAVDEAARERQDGQRR